VLKSDGFAPDFPVYTDYNGSNFGKSPFLPEDDLTLADSSFMIDVACRDFSDLHFLPSFAIFSPYIRPPQT
jgi:hypothetical protein